MKKKALLSEAIWVFEPDGFEMGPAVLVPAATDDTLVIDEGEPLPLLVGAGDVTGLTVGAAKPVASIAQLADYLVNGFWQYNGTIAHRFASNTITYNINALNSAEQFLAVSAMQAWHDVANINFVQTSGAANLTFSNSGSMQAYTSAAWYSSGAIAYANIVISSDWITNDGGAYDGKTGIDSYGYQTYIHEIGHALGLGHQGPYNGSASYSTNAIYANDTWQYSIMSYFSENNYSGSSYRYVVTPQMADIYAMGSMYGAASATRTGDTVYGFNSNAGAVFNFSAYSPAPALTIYDSGGNDTLDCSGYSNAQIIDLRAGSFSSVGGLVNNIGIALNAVIEKAIGGAGNDTLIAGSVSCVLSGGGGDDTITSGAGDDIINGDLGIDTSVYSGIFANYAISYNASTQTFTIGDKRPGSPDGTDTLTGVENFKFVDGTFVSSALVPVTPVLAESQLASQSPDFNADGKTDLLLLNALSSGVAVWELSGSQVLANPQVGIMGSGFDYAAKGDFNDDGKTDLLFYNSATHDLTAWLMNGTQIATSSTIGTMNAAGGWQFADVGDFNGDGKTDLLFLNNATKGVAVWQLNGTQVTANPQVGAMPQGFHFASTGDFNGDGKTDLLMINDTTHTASIWQMNGAQVTSITTVGHINAAGGWHFASVGDFNGDGNTDMFLLNDTTHGAAIWSINNNQVIANPQIGAINAAGGWHFSDIGDFNGDGKSDLLLQNSANKALAVWQMDGTQVMSNPAIGIAAAGDTYVGLQDVNGDHKSDILFSNSMSHALTMWEMNGTQVEMEQQIGTVNAAGGWHLFA